MFIGIFSTTKKLLDCATRTHKFNDILKPVLNAGLILFLLFNNFLMDLLKTFRVKPPHF